MDTKDINLHRVDTESVVTIYGYLIRNMVGNSIVLDIMNSPEVHYCDELRPGDILISDNDVYSEFEFSVVNYFFKDNTGLYTISFKNDKYGAEADDIVAFQSELLKSFKELGSWKSAFLAVTM